MTDARTIIPTAAGTRGGERDQTARRDDTVAEPGDYTAAAQSRSLAATPRRYSRGAWQLRRGDAVAQIDGFPHQAGAVVILAVNERHHLGSHLADLVAQLVGILAGENRCDERA